MKHKWLKVIFLCLSLTALNQSALAEDDAEDRFIEIGAGFTVIDAPLYAGSDKNNLYLLPFPYVVYQSNKVSLNREGLNRHLFSGEEWDIDLSFAGRLPVREQDSDARKDMPELDWLFQAGPAFNYYFVRDEDTLLKFQLPVHYGLTTDFTYVDYAGYEFAPNIRFEQAYRWRDSQFRLISTISAFYGNDDFNQLYYSVAPEFANSERPAYQAKAGNAGTQFMLGLTRRKDDFWMGAFIRYRSIKGAVFADSPLVRQNDNWYAGLAFAWIIHRWELD